MTDQAKQSIEREERDWRAEVRASFVAIPHKPVFGMLLLAWVLLFFFVGNSTQGYVKSPNLFAWMSFVYDMGPDDRHGYMIPFAVLGFLWWKRGELATATTKFWWPAAGVLFVAIVVHLLGFMAQQARISIVGFFVGIWALVGMVWGPVIMRRTFFPFLLFVFCVPLAAATDTLTFPLRKFATAVTVKICNLLSIGVQQQGTNIIDPGGRYQYDVAAACSGIRSLTAICALTAAYAFVFFTKSWKRAIVLLLAVPLAVISNVLRLLTIVLASEIAGLMGRSSQAAGGYVHDSTVISLMPYVVAFFGVLLVARRLKEDRDIDIMEVGIPVGIGIGVSVALGWLFNRNVDAVIVETGGPGRWVLLAPFFVVIVAMFLTQREAFQLLTRRAVAVGVTGLLIIGAFGGFLAKRQLWQRLSEPGVKVIPEKMYAFTETNRILAATNSVYLPRRVLAYDSQPLPLSKLVYDWLPKDTVYGQRRYVSTNGPFWLDNMVVLMGADRTSIHKPQYCIVGQGFTIISEETDSIRMTAPTPYDLPVKRLTFKGNVMDDGKRREATGVFVYWFVSDSDLSSEHGERMWRMGYDLVRTGVVQRWAYVICMAFCEPGKANEDATYEKLKEFIRASVPEYQLTTGKPSPELSSMRTGK
ncbi:MAG TPA: exosortase/archaeosortase family protein [Candidatus Acidoferrum sp.]|nr:exosortase/archaeosortase family protein [Candidatus Acidoferrum sp.]